VFQPVKIGGREYVDGGLVAPVPVRAARKMGAQVVIAVDISSPPEASAANGTLEILLQTFTIMGKSISTIELKDADVLVRPALQGVSSADFGARKRSIEAGRQAMQAALPQLRAAIEAKTHWVEGKKKASFCNEALKGSLNPEVTKGPEETTVLKLSSIPDARLYQGFPLEIPVIRKIAGKPSSGINASWR